MSERKLVTRVATKEMIEAYREAARYDDGVLNPWDAWEVMWDAATTVPTAPHETGAPVVRGPLTRKQQDALIKANADFKQAVMALLNDP